MRKGKFKFTNKNGAEEQVALETLLDQIVDSPIRALMPYTEYRKGEIIFDKELPLCFWVCVYAGMTGDKSSLNVLKETKSYGKVVECGNAMFITHVTPYIPTMKTFDAYAKLESPHLTGIPTAPTASSNNNSTQIATTEFVKTALAMFNLDEYLKVADAQRTYAPLNSPFFSGNPKAPNPNYSSDDNSLATTNFVRRLIKNSNGGIIAQSLGQNGYVKFANGLILQWGLVTGNWSANAYGSATIDVIFPIAFARAAYSINIISNEEHIACSIKSSPTKKGFSNSLWCSSGNTFTGTACWWVAVGE